MDWNNEDVQRLIKAILALKTEDDVKDFLRRVVRQDEIDEISKRLLILELLSKKTPHSEIKEKTGMDLETIESIAKWLEDQK